jgi:hypothetical protein
MTSLTISRPLQLYMWSCGEKTPLAPLLQLYKWDVRRNFTCPSIHKYYFMHDLSLVAIKFAHVTMQ